MKEFLNYFFLIVIVSFITSGCDKDNITPDDDPLHPDKNALKISKIADNSAMIDPLWEFEYDSDGRLVGITGEENRGTTTITYNSEDLPELITWVTDDFSGGDESEYYDTTNIVWGNNSYVADYTYTLDATGNIIDISSYDGSRGYESTWQEGRAEISYYRDGSKEWAQTRVYNEYSSPLSAINLAIINACEISWINDECEEVFQNKYCLTTNSSADEGSADYDYEYNDDGYPTEILIMETTDNWIAKFYFEYEVN